MAIGVVQTFKWALVSTNKKIFDHKFIFSCCFSISGATGTVFAYLGEFLASKTRSRSMMISCVIFAGFCMFLPIMAWLLINQSWSFEIPLVQMTYKPWRLFLLACGLPSLFCGLAIMFFPESPKFTFSQVRFIFRVFTRN